MRHLFSTILVIFAGAALGWLPSLLEVPKAQGDTPSKIHSLSPARSLPTTIKSWSSLPLIGPNLDHWGKNPSADRIQADLAQADFVFWASLHPGAALEKTALISDEAARARAQFLIIRAATTADPESFLTLLGSITDQKIREIAIASLGAYWGRMDPRKGWGLNIGGSEPEQNRYRAELIRTAAEDDGAAAASLALSVTDPKIREQLFQSASMSWPDSDPQAAADFFFNHPPTDVIVSDMNLLNVLCTWMDAEPFRVAEWIKALPEGQAKQAASNGYISNLSVRDPEAAIDVTAQLQGPMLQKAVEHVARDLGYKDPSYAVEWLSTITDSTAFEKGAHELASAWSYSNHTECAEWLKTLSEGKARDGAIDAFATSVAKRNPQTAATWAMSISNPTLRNERLQDVFSNWIARDPASAKTWLNHSILPETQKAGLLRQ